MDAETQKYYEALFEMYGTDGWKALMQDLSEHAKHYESIHNVSHNTPLEFQKGRLDEVNFLLNHEDTMKAAYEELLSADI